MSKRAILSVYDKSGLVDFGRALAGLGWELVASGGTARMLRKVGLPVQDVAALTGAPEMLAGRVKTLHPAIHAGILARDLPADRAELSRQGIGLIDLVACNLYPFQETVRAADVTLDIAVENIDIGGVTLLRAAAKNFARVYAVVDPGDYGRVLEDLRAPGDDVWLRRALAVKAFAHTAAYDAAVAGYLQHVHDTGSEG